MNFYPNTLFHIYNQGNNRQQVFFTDENYYFFLWKMRAYLLPFGDMVAYCLMPNHFHWLFYVKETEVDKLAMKAHLEYVEMLRKKKKAGVSEGVTLSDTLTTVGSDTLTPIPFHGSGIEQAIAGVAASEGVTSSDTLTADSPKITLNESIGILQRSYTRAINKAQNRTGSLFRKECKAQDGWIEEFVTLTNKAGKQDFRFLAGSSYAWQCFNYIHENPPKAKLALKPEDWPFSSARDYAGMRHGTLCNLELGRQLIQML